MEKKKYILSQEMDIDQIKFIVNGLQNKNPKELNQNEIYLIYIFQWYQMQLIQMIYVLVMYQKYLPIIKSFIWIEKKYDVAKNYLLSFF